MLCRDELDVGIAFAPVHSPELEAIPLLTESLALVVAQHHPLAVHEQVALSRLHDEKLVLLSAEFATREQIDHYCEKAGLHPQVVIEANSISAVLELIRRTSLSTLLPAAIATQHDGLKAISLAPPLLERTAVLLRRKNSWQTAAAKAFLQMALDKCAVLELIRRTSLSTLLPAAIATQHDGLKAISLAPPLLERTAVLLRRKNSWQTAAAKAFLHMALDKCAVVGGNESR